MEKGQHFLERSPNLARSVTSGYRGKALKIIFTLDGSLTKGMAMYKGGFQSCLQLGYARILL